MHSLSARNCLLMVGMWVAATAHFQVRADAAFTKIKVRRSDTQVLQINNSGAVAGQYTVSGIDIRAFVKRPDGHVADFGVNGAIVTIPRGLTDDGAVGGRYDLPDDSYHGFLRDASGVLTTFDGPGLGIADIAGMNRGNNIAGTYFLDEGQNLDGFIRRPDGSFVLFHIEDVYPNALYVAGIDAKGEVAGSYMDMNFESHGFLREQDGAFDMFDPPEGEGIAVAAISSRGWIAGTHSKSAGVVHGFLRKRDSSFQSFDVPGAITAITAINRKGDITGCYANHFVNHGFIRKASGKLISFDLPWGETSNMCPQAINDAGQVAGYVRYGTFGENQFGFIRTP